MEKLGIKFKGHVKITIGQRIVQDNNTIGPDATEITLKALANANEYIDKVRLFNGVTQVAEKEIDSITYPTASQVRFITNWDEASFNGSFDNMKLLSVSGKVMATKVLPGAETKSDTETMVLEWTLTI
jgi:hypothetical protein